MDTPKQNLKALLEAVLSMGSDAPGEHLSAQEIQDFTLGKMTTEQIALHDRHLMRCPSCATILSELAACRESGTINVQERKTKSESVFAKLKGVLVKFDEAVRQLREEAGNSIYQLHLGPSLNFGTPKAIGMFYCKGELDAKTDELVVKIGSNHSLEQIELKLNTGTWERIVTLQPVDAGKVSAEVRIPRQDLTAESVLTITPILN
jgi:hypothetical protein